MLMTNAGSPSQAMPSQINITEAIIAKNAITGRTPFTSAANCLEDCGFMQNILPEIVLLRKSLFFVSPFSGTGNSLHTQRSMGADRSFEPTETCAAWFKSSFIAIY